KIKEGTKVRFIKKFDASNDGKNPSLAEFIVSGKLFAKDALFTSDGYIKEKGDYYGIIFEEPEKSILKESKITEQSKDDKFSNNYKNLRIKFGYKGIEFLKKDEKLKIKDSEISNSNYGIYFNGKNIEIENSKISLNDTGIYVLKGKGYIKETEIKENEIGILYKGNSEINVDKSYIMNNKIGIYVDENSKPKLKNGKNYICYNSEYNLYNNTIFDIEAQRNYWGTENRDSISLFIYDFYDDQSKGIVYFEPIWVPEKEILSGIQGDKEKIIDFIKINTISKKNFEIEIILNKNSEISLKVYDVSGRKIKEIERKLNSGTHKLEIDNLKKGIYFLEIGIGEKKKKYKILKI
ncbi:MAG: T9SS type A sorting domain-containing protein, partial [candidate division WOR-3 bacterium]